MRVTEGDVANKVVALATNTADAQTMGTIAIDVVDKDVHSGSNGNAVILVDDLGVENEGVVGSAEIETVTVVGGRKTIANSIRCISGRIVQSDALEGKAVVVASREAMSRVVLDVQVLDVRSAGNFANDEKVIRLRDTTVATYSVPVGLSVAINDSAGCTTDGDVGSRHSYWVEGGGVGKIESSRACESDMCTSLQLCKVECSVCRHVDIAESDSRARSDCRGDQTGLRDSTGAS